jgi:rRNA maturation RNase YbeY
VKRTDGPRVAIIGATRRFIRAHRLRRAALLALGAAAPRVRGELTVVLTDDAEIRELNRRYRGRDGSTDVLSFSLGDGHSPETPFGDIVISLQTARRQAREYGASLQTELERLLVHGTLHLCGYDHRERREAARMHGLTRRLLAKLAHDGAKAV